MTQVFDETGQVVPVTVVQAGPVRGHGRPHPGQRRLLRCPDRLRRDRPPQGHQAGGGLFEKAGVTPRRYLAEIRTDDASEYTLGQELTAELFAAGQRST
jgi:large subunit ribosomal protein L3